MRENYDDPRRLFWTLTHYRRWVATLIPDVSDDVDISLQQLNVLYLIRVQDASMADMARMLMVAPTVITGVVDRMEARGLVRRERHPTDRRRIQLELTDLGRSISERFEEMVAQRIEQQLSTLTPSERKELSRGLHLLQRVVDELERSAAEPEGAALPRLELV